MDKLKPNSIVTQIKSSSNAKEAPGEHKIVAGLKEAVAYAQGDRLQGRETKMYERRFSHPRYPGDI